MWVERFEQEEDWKAVLDDYFRQWYDSIISDPKGKADRLFFRDKSSNLIDYKIDDNISKTNQVFIELYRNKDSNRYGWAYTSKADIIIYLAVPDTIYIFHPEMVWEKAWDWKKKYKTVLTKRGSSGILVPESEFAGNCLSVRRLT